MSSFAETAYPTNFLASISNFFSWMTRLEYKVEMATLHYGDWIWMMKMEMNLVQRLAMELCLLVLALNRVV